MQPLPPPSSPPPPLWQRLLVLVEGQLAQLPYRERARLIRWQEERTRAALGQMLSLLTLAAAVKVALVLLGVWTVGLPGWLHASALGIMAGARWSYGRARGLLLEGVTATVFLGALVVILADPAPGWEDRPVRALGWIWLLAALGIPLLARLRSVAVFALLLFGAALAVFLLAPIRLNERLTITLLLAMSIAGGVLLRRLRSDMTLNYYRSTEAATASANTDTLTLLANRRGWREQAPRMLEQSFQRQQPISLLFIDLDHFKRLNDEQGHAAGDDALVRVGKLLQESVGAGLAARLGGEEFVCLLPGMGAQETVWFAEAVAQTLKQPPGALTFSGGVAEWQPRETLAELLARGDAAMYRAKQAGRDQVLIG